MGPSTAVMALPARVRRVLPALVLEEVAPAEFRSGESFLQSVLWGTQKAAFGWTPRYLRVTLENGGFDLLVLVRAVFAGRKLAYVPHGPGQGDLALLSRSALAGRGDSGWRALDALGRGIAAFLGGGFLAVRFDPLQVVAERPAFRKGGDTDGDDTAEALVDARLLRKALKAMPLVRAPGDIQPPDTVVTDLSGGQDAVLEAMKPKTRYNIRLAARKGVEVRACTAEKMDAWYDLYRETAERDRIGIHSREYYRTLLEKNPGTAELLMASHEGEDLAGIVLVHHGRTTTYLYGASSNRKRNLMATYLLQWEGMCRGMARGSTEYDHFGIPPSNDPAHPMHGLYQVKTGYGGRVVHRAGTLDCVCAPLSHGISGWAESVRFGLLRNLRKRFRT